MFAESLPESFIKSLSIRVKDVGGINLGQGIPSFPTAPHILDAARSALAESDIGIYPHLMGNHDFREAIAEKLRANHGLSDISSHDILITVGAMEATAAVMFSLIGDGDRVGVVTPDYANHFSQIQLARGVAVHIPLKEDDNWSLDIAHIEHEAKRGMKLLLITNPNNPTGAVFPKSQIEAIVQLSDTYGFWVLSDETYWFLTYGERAPSLIDFWHAENPRLLTVRSFSKEYAMTGWRVGYLVAKKEVRDLIGRAHDALVGTAPRISQRAAHAAIVSSQDIVAEYVREFTRRRSILCEGLDAIENAISYVPPRGAYYVMVRYASDMSSTDLSNNILEKVNVGVVPGSIFGEGGEHHFRISFGVTDELLRDALIRLKQYFKGR